MAWEHLNYDIAHFVLSFFYVGLLFLTLLALLRIRREGKLAKPWQYGFYSLLIIGSIVRAIYFFLQPFIMESMMPHMSNAMNFALNIWPSLLFFSAYLIILFNWIDVYYSTKSIMTLSTTALIPSSSRRVFSLSFWTVNILLYTVVAVLDIIDMFVIKGGNSNVSDSDTWAEYSISIILASSYILGSIAFLYFGIRLYLQFKKLENVAKCTQSRKSMRWRLKTMVALVPLCFTIRACIMVYGLFINLSIHWYFDITYYSILEILPMILLLQLLHFYNPSDNTNKGVNQSSSKISM